MAGFLYGNNFNTYYAIYRKVLTVNFVFFPQQMAGAAI